MKYLSPIADLTFKKVFGEHPKLVISLLNALLPFDSPEEEICEITYLPIELVPETPLKKNSIVDVRCKDRRGRQFLVEMQMLWSSSFMQRVLFNASKAYVRQLGGGKDYELLQPVYSLNLVNDVFLPDVPEYYHDYRIVQVEHTDKVIEGLRFIFVELPKFTPKNYGDKKMQVLWLRYLTEINEETQQVPRVLLDNPEIKQAVSQLKLSAFNDAQLLGYDDFWDSVRVERAILNDALKNGREEGRREGREEGRQEGREEGRLEGREEGIREGLQEGERNERLRNARGMKLAGIAAELIAQITGLTVDEVTAL